MRNVITLLAIGIAAQAQVSTGVITGIVSDISGGIIPNAAIRVTDVDTGVVRELTTDSAGLYTASDLLPGNYQVAVSFPGLQSRVETGLVLSIGKTVTVNFSLPPAQRSDTVTVEAGVQLDTTTSTMSDVIGEKLVAQLPLNGRDFSNLIGLAAGFPNNMLGSSSGGQNFGQILTIVGNPRQIQFALKLLF